MCLSCHGAAHGLTSYFLTSTHSKHLLLFDVYELKID
jgi:hypothetical protein